MLTAPLPQAHADFPIVQYADDTLLPMEADEHQLMHLKDLLNTFATSTGLKVNYSKSLMIPINLTHQRADQLAQSFGCQIDHIFGASHGHHQAKYRGFISNYGQNRKETLLLFFPSVSV